MRLAQDLLEPREAGLGRPRFGLALVAVVLLALWARLTVWREVFVAGEVLTRDPDADYHLLRIARTLEHFPFVPVIDPQLNWPEGGPCPWAPGFDALGALFVLLTGAGGDPAAIERAAAFYPVALGLGLVLACVALARQLLPRSGRERDALALGAGALVAVLPRAVTASSLGRVDHHVFEALVYVLLGSWALRASAVNDAPAEGRSGAGWRFELHGAAVITLAGAGFSGSILYTGLAAAIVAGHRLAAPVTQRTPWLGSGAPALALSALALWLLYAPAVAAHGSPWDFRLASHLQPTLHAVLALGCALAAGLARVGGTDAPLATRLGRRSAWLAGLGLAAGVALALWPGLGEEIWRGARDWLGTRDPWLASIDEFQPLYRPGDWRSWLDFNGWTGLLAPVAIAAGLWLLARERPATALAFGAWALALLPLAVLRTRFATPATAAFAICAALALVALTRVLAARALPVRPALVATALAFCVLAADPATRAMLRLRPAREPTALESVTLALRALPDPAPGGPRGALAQWSHGHTVLRLGRRPVLSAGFGHWTGAEAFAASERFMGEGQTELLQLMDERRLGFVITGMSAPFPAPGDRPGDPHKPFVLQEGRVVWNAPYFRALPLTPLILGGSGDPELGVPHVAHLMPQYVSPQGAPGMGFPLHRLWLYERVAGARLVGRAAPGSRVVAETALRVWGQPTRHRAWTRADEAGRYELVLSLPTGRHGEALATGEHVQVRVEGRSLARLALSEDQVRAGSRIELPAAPDAPALARRR